MVVTQKQEVMVTLSGTKVTYVSSLISCYSWGGFGSTLGLTHSLGPLCFGRYWPLTPQNLESFKISDSSTMIRWCFDVVEQTFTPWEHGKTTLSQRYQITLWESAPPSGHVPIPIYLSKDPWEQITNHHNVMPNSKMPK